MTSQQLAGTIVIGTTGQLAGIKRPLEIPRSRSRSGKEEERYTYRGTYRVDGAGGGAGEGEIKSSKLARPRLWSRILLMMMMMMNSLSKSYASFCVKSVSAWLLLTAREPSKDSSRKDKTHGWDEADSPREQRNQQLHHRDHLDGDPDPNTAEDLDDHLAAADCRRMMNCPWRHKCSNSLFICLCCRNEGQRIHMQIMEYPRMLMSIDCSQLQGKSDREEPEDLNQTPWLNTN